MKAASDFENAVRKAVGQAAQDGAHPILIVGILDTIKADIQSNLRNTAAEMQRSQIVRSTTLPANGHQ